MIRKDGIGKHDGKDDGTHNKSTPTSVRARARLATENANADKRTIMNERRQEATCIADNDIRENADSLFVLVEPESSVKVITEEIIGAAMTTINEGFSALKVKKINAVLSKEKLNKFGKLFSLDRAVEATFRLSRLNHKPYSRVREAGMYPLFRDFVMLVAHHVKSGAERHNNGFSTEAKGKSKKSSAKPSPYLILPYDGGDYKPLDSDDSTKIDGALALCKPSTEIGVQSDPKYKDILGIEELKRLENEQRSAYVQLIEYTRQIYATQEHRRFAWGLTMCGTVVRCCLFHHDGVRATSNIDISESDGLKRLVTLFVHWSFCSAERLGYDTSMTRVLDTDTWEIKCADRNVSGASPRITSYVTTSTIMSASALLGRHTRCYRAIRKGSKGGKEVVIKDSWSLPRDRKNETTAADAPDEAQHMDLIRRRLENKELDFAYPLAVCSGSVQLLVGNKYVTDDTTNVYEYDGNEEQELFRVHRRIVMAPVGRHIHSVKNEAELVLVLADAMQCHNAILEECELLHRDISVNNILVIRDFVGKSTRRPVKGLLIDFDHAISVTQESSGNATRSGTLPFMSIHNLEQDRSKRTALDDWESLLYLVCWLGTFGINSADSGGVKKKKAEEISKWRSGEMQDIADAKRKHMHSLESFETNILVGFQDKYMLLKRLAVRIYKALFQHEGCKGASRDNQGLDMLEDSPTVLLDRLLGRQHGDQPAKEEPQSDPLAKRKEPAIEKSIVENLLAVIGAESEIAKEYLERKAAKDGKKKAASQ
ncbi:hypothetical protein LPJ59_003712 [Coemansia sp. RSA 2399]|nr:hypothetical protein LPJ59_003712 [Coemansia sp. RSA 2399]KAJ1902864.1 hypothetical protein LPJ81_003371 [Coemansia sp. IMI 209127]